MAAAAVDVEENAYYSSWEAPSNTTLTRGVDFDEVVLGIPVSALPYVSGELSRASPRWKRMLDGSGSVATQALQLWVSSSLRDLGYRGPPTLEPDPPSGVSLTAFAHPFSTWSDMTHLLPAEGWDNESSVPTPPKSLAYFIGVLPDESPSSFPPLSDHDYPDRMRARVLENSVTYVEQRLPELWPVLNRTGGAGVAPLLVGGGRRAKRAAQDVRAALETQYYRANVDPSARYNLPMPGGISGTRLTRRRGRRSRTCSSWATGLSTASTRAALVGDHVGMLAARELIGVPRDSVFTDYFMQAGEWEP